MASCSRCSRAVPDGSRFCPACGAPFVDGGTALGTQTSLPSHKAPLTPSYPTPQEARFLPGNMIAGRYRIGGLLGRGGMGEVYRADDLKLGQPVALKFLPEEVERDTGRLQRFLNEVRLALRITHPNVCRVYDIGEVDGQHFISMEYVDGEDLASLLRRIGRLPQERAVELARQLCSAVAAAHDQGILHRDLKPANVMIDGRGRARITDFGLAGLTGKVEGIEVRAGTPAYMAPEQLEGREVTERSDIYALGLVLYEMFSGKPAFRAKSVAEILQLQHSTTPGDLSSIPDMEPAVEQAILRALSPDPSRRPQSVAALAAALPGGDPLAAALAAGETPSPEMVAEAGEDGGTAPWIVGLALAAIVAMLLLGGFVAQRNHALGLTETPLSVDALNERARLMLERLGYDEPPGGMAHGVESRGDYARWLREEPDAMRDRIGAGRPPLFAVWHRQSPHPLVTLNETADRPSRLDPPPTVPGMVEVLVDPQGRLVELNAVPPDRAPAADDDAPAVDRVWADLMREAEVDPSRFTPVDPVWTPQGFADSRAAWEGTFAEAPETTVRIEAAAFAGRPVSFRLVGPWTRAAADRVDESNALQQALMTTVFIAVMSCLVWLGRRNIRLGRCDLKGARRIGFYIVALETLRMLFAGGWAVGGPGAVGRFLAGFAFNLLLGTIAFAAYVALEPYVRRLWPHVLIAWTRLLSGRVRDPLVGRDFLIGGAFGVLTVTIEKCHTLLPGLLGLHAEPIGTSINPDRVGALSSLANDFNMAGGAVALPLLALVVLVVLRLVLRRTALALGFFWLFSTIVPSLGSRHLALDIAMFGAVTALTLFVLMRLGLLAAVGLWYFDWLGQAVDTLDFSAWTAPSVILSVVILLLLAAYASFIAIGGRAVFDDRVMGEAARVKAR